MEPTSVTVEILKEIRDGVGQLSGRIDQTNVRLDGLSGRIDETNLRLDAMREELSRRIVASEIRTATAITDLAGTVQDLTSVLRAQHDLRPRLEQCEREIAKLKRTRR